MRVSYNKVRIREVEYLAVLPARRLVEKCLVFCWQLHKSTPNLLKVFGVVTVQISRVSGRYAAYVHVSTQPSHKVYFLHTHIDSFGV